jgi:hypothetical protein
MSDLDFDKSFSEEFRKGRFEEPSPEKWERVSATLRQNEDKKRRRRAALLCLPYLLTAASLGLLVWNMKANERQLWGLQTQIGQLGTALKACGERALESPIKVADAAAKTTVPPIAQRTSSGHIGTINKAYKMEKNGGFNMGYELKPLTAFLSDNATQADSTPSLLTEINGDLMPEKIDSSIFAKQQQSVDREGTVAEQESAVYKSKPAETGLSGTGLEITVPLADLPIIKGKQNRPARFGIGLNLSFESPWINIDQPRNRLPYYANACFLFNKGWRLEAGYEIKKFQFSSSGIVNPRPPLPPSVDYSINKTDFTDLTSYYSIGVHRNFRLKKRFQPSLLVELLAIQRHKTRIDYNYTSQNPPSPDVTISIKDGYINWNFDNLRFGTGLSYKILPWLEGRAQFGFRVNNVIQEKYPSYWNIYYKIGVMGYF